MALAVTVAADAALRASPIAFAIRTAPDEAADLPMETMRVLETAPADAKACALDTALRMDAAEPVEMAYSRAMPFLAVTAEALAIVRTNSVAWEIPTDTALALETASDNKTACDIPTETAEAEAIALTAPTARLTASAVADAASRPIPTDLTADATPVDAALRCRPIARRTDTVPLETTLSAFANARPMVTAAADVTVTGRPTDRAPDAELAEVAENLFPTCLVSVTAPADAAASPLAISRRIVTVATLDAARTIPVERNATTADDPTMVSVSGLTVPPLDTTIETVIAEAVIASNSPTGCASVEDRIDRVAATARWIDRAAEEAIVATWL